MATRKSDRTAQGGDFCSAYQCQNARNKISCKGLPFFRLPTKDGPRCRQWIQNMRRADLVKKLLDELAQANIKVCAIHFEDSQFTVPTERKRLNWNAVPTIFKVPNPPPTLDSKRPLTERPFIEPPPKRRHVEHEDSPVEPFETVTPAAKNLAQKLKSVQNQLYRTQQRLRNNREIPPSLDTVMSQLSRYLPDVTADFVKMQMAMFLRDKHGRRWDAKDKAMALSLYHASRKAYCLLCKLFVLPSISTLRKTVRDIKIFPGLSQPVISLLAQKVGNMSSTAKLCSLVFDEMSIKENVSYSKERDEVEGLEDFGFYGRTKFVANHATVFLARGLILNWKQPVGYFLSSGPIKSVMLKLLIEDCVRRLLEVGLDVKCLVADQGSNNRKALKDLGVTEDAPFILIDNKEILVFYDPPHLLKNIRNNLKKSGFKSDMGSVEWRHVVNFYNVDSQNSVRMAPKLTQKHITLPPFTSLKVRYATQILSHSVAAGISFISKFTKDDDAAATASFIENFDSLFNAFNSGTLSSTQKMGHAFSSNSGHISFLDKMLTWLQTVAVGLSRNIYCLSGWRQDIRALLLLWEDLSGNYDVKFLFTDRLNQDCIENVFSRIRGHISRVDSPSATQFRTFLRNVMVDSIFHHSTGSNCKEDQDAFLFNLQHFTDSSSQRDRQAAAVFDDNSLPLPRSTENINMASHPSTPLLKSMECNVLTYIAGYIAKNVSSKVCTLCQDVLKGEATGSHDEVFLSLKQHEGAVTGLTIPSKGLVTLVCDLEAIYKREIPHLLHVSTIKTRLLAKLNQTPHVVSCATTTTKCNLFFVILTVFLNIRLHFTLKDCSESFKSSATRTNRKLMKVSHL